MDDAGGNWTENDRPDQRNPQRRPADHIRVFQKQSHHKLGYISIFNPTQKGSIIQEMVVYFMLVRPIT